jgi:membrane-bound lytic murein transglycosylase B
VKTVALIGGMVALMPVLVLSAALTDVSGAAGNAVNSAAQSAPAVAIDGIPALYLSLFQQAAARFGLPWELLAAIGKIESDDGRDPAAAVPNAAGAVGPMQFEPATFAEYSWAAGVPDPSIDSPHDAIEAAAAMLASDGAPSDTAAAVFDYNHAEWYVAEVLSLEATYTRQAGSAAPANAAAPAG